MVLEVGKVDKFKLSNNNENKSSVLSAVFLKHELLTVCCIFRSWVFYDINKY